MRAHSIAMVEMVGTAHSRLCPPYNSGHPQAKAALDGAAFKIAHIN
jgi:hypothetical protein